MTNLDSILKNRDITLPTKVCMVKTVIFSQKSCTDVRLEPKRLRAKELILSNYGV